MVTMMRTTMMVLTAMATTQLWPTRLAVVYVDCILPISYTIAIQLHITDGLLKPMG